MTRVGHQGSLLLSSLCQLFLLCSSLEHPSHYAAGALSLAPAHSVPCIWPSCSKYRRWGYARWQGAGGKEEGGKGQSAEMTRLLWHASPEAGRGVCERHPQVCGPGRCIPRRGGYTCVCDRGYWLSPQGTHCVGELEKSAPQNPWGATFGMSCRPSPPQQGHPKDRASDGHVDAQRQTGFCKTGRFWAEPGLQHKCPPSPT